MKAFCLFYGLRLPKFQRFFPFHPGNAAFPVFDRHKKSVIQKPAFVILHKLLKPIVQLRFDTSGSLSKQRKPVFVQRPVIRLILSLSPESGFRLPSFKITVPDQQLQIDKIRISRKTGKGLIGGISVACGAYGKHLPVFLSGLFQKIHEITGFGTQCSDPVF